MSPENQTPAQWLEGRSATVEVLRLQLEANEKLVLAALRAHEEADRALAAQLHAEGVASDLREREVELHAAAELREQLIGIIGHDLRSPLNTIVMAGGLLIQGGDLIDADTRLANRIVNSGQRMARMIDQLVTFTRARLGGGFELELAPSDLGVVCHDIAEELRIGSSSEIRQTTKGALHGTWDADKLSEAVSNIAGNAVDHSTPGTPVLIEARDEGGAVVVEITNHGTCIPPDLLPVIFKPFRRAEPSASAKGTHMGLGLYIASEVVRAHGGQIDVRSSEGTTTFTLRVPRVATPPESARTMKTAK